MRLSDFTEGRDNNFNLIRICAAYAVLISHSFTLALGSGVAEPFQNTLGMKLGTMAVDVFFITSGFLVTASLMRRQSIIDFVWARVLRIFPALLVMLVITVFGLGWFMTKLPTLTYFSDPKIYTYFLKCLTLLSGVSNELPGVFMHNPHKIAVNGSLWTLPREVKMYAILAGSWAVLSRKPNLRMLAFKLAIVSAAVSAGVFLLGKNFGLFSYDSRFMRLFFMFFIGSAFFVCKKRIVLSRTGFYLALVLLLAATCEKQVFFVLYILTVAYILFFVAYIPSGIVRKYNSLGDYSYGIYIYAFPIQQTIVALLPGVEVWMMILLSSLITLCFAMLSWHLLENKALKLKERYINYTLSVIPVNQIR